MPWPSASVAVGRALLISTLLVTSTVVDANPTSRPYIPFRTSPYNHSHLHHSLSWDDPVDPTIANNNKPISSYDADAAVPDPHCPLQFSLGVSRRHHHAAPGLGIAEPPVIFPILPELGPGRQVLYTTHYEHLDLLTPLRMSKDEVIQEGLIQHMEYPLLFESSAFLTSPILRDVNMDGIVDVILADYDGGIYAMGLKPSPDNNKRYFHKAQVPRLHVRRQWLESRVNETLGIDMKPKEDEDGAKTKEKQEPLPMADDIPMHKYASFGDKPFDPYHSYFEYTYGTSHEHETVLRGVPANVLGQDQEHVIGLETRRQRKIKHHHQEEEVTASEPGAHFEDEEEAEVAGGENEAFEEDKNGEAATAAEISENAGVEAHHRRLTEDVSLDTSHRRLQNVEDHKEGQGQPDTVKADEGQAEPVHEHANVGEEKEASHISEEHDVKLDEAEAVAADEHQRGVAEAAAEAEGENPDYLEELAFDGEYASEGDDAYTGHYGDDMLDAPPVDIVEEGKTDDAPPVYGDDDYPRHGDANPRYDDYYGRYGNSEHDEYYDDKHYVRIPPHILCTPVAADLPKMYSQNGELETLLFIAVSYYLDEDEYEGFFSYKRFRDRDHGDETEVQRGMYLANAIMVYQYGDAPRWGRQEHLDLSADHSAPINTTLVGTIPLQQDNTKMGAFALASPTVADLDGDGSVEVIMGTSMGLLYVLDARNLYARDGWPVQFRRGIETRVLVEDVRDDTNLEIFVADVGGTVACLNHKGEKLWHRHLVDSIAPDGPDASIIAASPMVLGDVDGDGMLDLVQLLQIRVAGGVGRLYLFAMSADTGKYLNSYPKRIDKTEDQPKTDSQEFVIQKLPAPLLVDLHSDQSWLESYLHRGGTSFAKPSLSRPGGKVPHGGPNVGLHIVFPVENSIVVMEGASGCAQTISIGDEVLAMVQADDVHGTGGLDLVITTGSGNVITLESPAAFHPLNVWNNGEMRGRTNAFAHGYSASQGIFVHDVSREYRDIFGVYIPVTFEIFDNRPNIRNEPDKKVYFVEIRVGTSQPIFRKTYNKVGVFTERMYIPHGPGYYQVTAMLKSTHGIIYEDTFHLGYNVNYMKGFGFMLWLPLLLASIAIFLCGTKKTQWDDEGYDGDDFNGSQGILGGPLPD